MSNARVKVRILAAAVCLPFALAACSDGSTSGQNATPAATAGGTPAATAGGTPAATAGGTPAATAGGTPAATAGGTPAATALSTMLPTDIRDSGVLRSGGPSNNKPLVYLGADGKTPEGGVIDLGDAMAAELGVKFQYTTMPFPGLIPALQAKKIDIVMSVMSDTAEREKTLDFVDFLKDGLGMLVQKGNPKAINDLPDLCGKTVAVLQGSLSVPLVQKTSDECKTDGKSPIDLKQFTEHSDAVVALQSGKADVVFVGVGQGKYDAATAGDGKLFDMSPGGPYLPSPFGIAIPKDETQLRDAIQAALQALVDNGTYDKILTQIGRSDGAYKTIPINDANAAGK